MGELTCPRGTEVLNGRGVLTRRQSYLPIEVELGRAWMNEGGGHVTARINVNLVSFFFIATRQRDNNHHRTFRGKCDFYSSKFQTNPKLDVLLCTSEQP